MFIFKTHNPGEASYIEMESFNLDYLISEIKSRPELNNGKNWGWTLHFNPLITEEAYANSRGFTLK